MEFPISFLENTSTGILSIFCSVTIFIMSSNLQSPPLYVIPLCGEPVSMMFLVHNPVAGGHYDAAIPYSCTINQNKLQDLVRKDSHDSCSCGVNKKTSKILHT